MRKKLAFIIRNVCKYRKFNIEKDFLVSSCGVSDGKMRFYSLLEDGEFLKKLDEYSIGFRENKGKIEFYLI